MKITDILKPVSIQLNVAPPKSKVEAINILADLMEKGGNLSNKEEYVKAVIAREDSGSTGLGDGIATPHAKSSAVREAGLAAMVVPQGMDFAALDGNPSRLFFMIAAPNSASDLHVQLLSKLATMLMDPDFKDALINAKSVDEFLQLINEKEEGKSSAEEAPAEAEKTPDGYEVLAVTACPTGIAHTYMAAESLEQHAKRKNISIKVIPVYDDGSLNYDAFLNLLSPKTKLVSITHMSNVLGTINPVKKITTEAHNAGAKVIIDGSQAITHFPIDVSDIDCDFFAFSGHKLYAPTGIGVLYGRENILHELPPWQGGGDMIKSVTMEKSIWADPPAKFEAGTPPIVQAIGLGAAIDYLNTIGMQNLHAFEQTIFNNMYYELKNIKGLKILGNAPEKGGLVSWVMEKIHPQDISMILNQMGIAVRVGHHCAQPITERMGVSASCRASIGIYNDLNDVKKLISGIYKVKDLIK